MTGTELIAAERERQTTKEHWTPEHDDGHTSGVMVDAAICYAEFAGFQIRTGRTDGQDYFMGMAPTPSRWKWDAEWWKPSDTDIVRNLVKAGALIAAEIDRLQRLAATPKEP